MKTFQSNTLIAIFFSILFLASCSKEVDERVIPNYESTNIESKGGTWKTNLFSSANDLTIPAPAAPGSASYQQEIEQIIASQNAITNAEKSAISKWQGSAVLKWNEIARGLVAKYNLPPEANADGTYPVPNPNNASAYPKFPFANPPYASRAYAYLHVAMYDALVLCWNYKFLYNRKSPAVNDTRVKSLEPVAQALPSYASEDAVVAQVAYRMLSVMFPNDSNDIRNLATEQKKSKVLSGVAAPSDILAGEVIADYVVVKALARYRTDGMGQALGNATIWQQLEDHAISIGITTPWESMESPARPPMLPMYGNVSQWLINKTQRDSLRPEPPPALGSAAFNEALEEVRGYMKNQDQRRWGIAMYWADGAGTYTPPGHWNEIACQEIAKAAFSELRAARALSLLNQAIQDAGISCWDAKAFYYYPRPSQMDNSIKTIGLPNFPSYTSGHSTFSAAASTVLGYLFPAEKANYEAMAKEASESRIYGGIHYRFDCEAGLRCGNAIGSFAVKKGQSDGAD